MPINYLLNNKTKLTSLKKDIDDYMDYLLNIKNKIDKIFFDEVISRFFLCCKDESILNLDTEYQNKIKRLILIMTEHIGKYSDANKFIELRHSLANLVDNYLSPCIGYSEIVIKQEFEVIIKPLSSSFSADTLNFKATKNSEVFEDGFLKLNNNHISSLNIDEKLYGVNGSLIFSLCHPLNHPDFEFLSSEKQSLIVDIKIRETYNIKDDPQSEYHSRETRFYTLGNMSNECYVSRDIFSSIKDEEYAHDIVQEYKVLLDDPLQSLWRLHKPNYIDFKKTVDDIIQENFFFDSIIDLKCSSSALQENFDQVFISTVDRDFYDFFIEQLYINNCFLKYYIGPDDEKVTYFVSDSLDSIKGSIKNSQKDVEQEFKNYDAIVSIRQTMNKKSPNSYASKSLCIPDINFEDAKIKNIQYEGQGSPFDNIYQTIFQQVNYLKQPEKIKTFPFGDNCEIEVETRSSFPYVNSEIDLSNISNNEEMLGVSKSDVILWRRVFSYNKSKYEKNILMERLLNIRYENDSEAESFEKIVFCPLSSLTHAGRIKYIFKPLDCISQEYPPFKSFKSFDFIGKIYIGDDVDDDNKKAYKFFKDYDEDESCLEDVQDEEEEGEDLIFNSKRDIFYEIEIINDLLGPECTEDPLIFVPVRININSSVNEFIPLRHDDAVILSLYDLTECYIHEVISNSAISLDKTEDIFQQRKVIGIKENCEISYIEEDDNETYLMKQYNEENENSILLNNKNGILIQHKTKED